MAGSIDKAEEEKAVPGLAIIEKRIAGLEDRHTALAARVTRLEAHYVTLQQKLMTFPQLIEDLQAAVIALNRRIVP